MPRRAHTAPTPSRPLSLPSARKVKPSGGSAAGWLGRGRQSSATTASGVRRRGGESDDGLCDGESWMIVNRDDHRNVTVDGDSGFRQLFMFNPDNAGPSLPTRYKEIKLRCNEDDEGHEHESLVPSPTISGRSTPTRLDSQPNSLSAKEFQRNPHWWLSAPKDDKSPRGELMMD